MKHVKKIGIFDSGIGGLTIAKTLLQHSVPEIIYCADKAFMPYGNKTPEQIVERSKIVVEQLVHRGAELIIIACHTASAYAADKLRNLHSTLPIISIIKPTALRALQQTSNNTIGLLATPATVASDAYSTIIQQSHPTIKLITQACPELASHIENSVENAFESQDITQSLKQHLNPLLKSSIDTLILGCTHYSLIKDQIQKLCGPNITIISSDEIITSLMPSTTGNKTEFNFFVIGDRAQLQQITAAVLHILPTLGN